MDRLLCHRNAAVLGATVNASTSGTCSPRRYGPNRRKTQRLSTTECCAGSRRKCLETIRQRWQGAKSNVESGYTTDAGTPYRSPHELADRPPPQRGSSLRVCLRPGSRTSCLLRCEIAGNGRRLQRKKNFTQSSQSAQRLHSVSK